jgi:hypothetical protein
MKLIVLLILHGAKVVLPNSGSGGGYEASWTVWGMAGGWLMPHLSGGAARPSSSARGKEVER